MDLLGALRPRNQEKINGFVPQYRIGQRVLVNVPIKFTGAYEGRKMLVESNGYFFWIHESVVTDSGRVYGLGDIVDMQNGIYKVKIFDDVFDCKSEYLSDKF